MCFTRHRGFEIVGSAMRALHQYPTEAVLAEITGEVESSHGGKVDFPEFIEILVKNMAEGDAEEELLEAFKVLDAEGFGYINSGELRNVLTTLGEKLTDEDLDDMIKEGTNLQKVALLHIDLISNLQSIHEERRR
eukprot:sb/3474678/